MVIWKRELTSYGDATWLVGVEPMRISVLAPPGVTISRQDEREAELLHGAPGWRWAIWSRDAGGRWPSIDRGRPDAMREIDTPGVLRLLGEEQHEFVWSCLWSQLQIARGFGCHEGGRVTSEDLARAGAISAGWLKKEMSRGFPERAHLLETALEESEIMAESPFDPAEFFEASRDVEDPPLPLRCGAPLRALLIHWVVWRLPPRSHFRWLAARCEATRPASSELDRPDRDVVDASGYSWGRHRAEDGEIEMQL